ncbi:MAG: hypothetical protein H7839_09010 [Magnetococcus sp. YQC-5]
MNDLFAAEALIVNRIQTLVPELRKVVAVMDLDGVTSQGQITPAAYVIYGGDEPVPGIDQECGDLMLEQHWLAVLAMKMTREESARMEAGKILITMDAALRGWQPDENHASPLIRVRSPPPLFEDGFGYFALRYSTHIFLSGVN